MNRHNPHLTLAVSGNHDGHKSATKPIVDGGKDVTLVDYSNEHPHKRVLTG